MLKIQRAEKTELSEIAALESKIFSDAWSEKSLEETWNQKNAEIFTARYRMEESDESIEKPEESNKIAGYVIFYYVLDEGEIARIAVSPEARRQKTATRIYQRLEKFCEEKEITKIMLEVRESNEAARAFYSRCGFKEDGIRKNYYDTPKENAVLMSVSLN